MGKAKKNKKQGARFNPLARGDAMVVDTAVEEPKRLSAHQQRYLERKNLKARVTDLKTQRRKVSKADKFEFKKQRKQLNAGIREMTKKANDRTTLLRHASPAAAPAAAVLPEGFAFTLPQPTQSAQAQSMQSHEEAYRVASGVR